MFITKLILHRCKRFYLKGIETFEVNPTMKTQIILGTNGSGKSSLLKIGFTVLPADARDFMKGGYKLVHVLNNGKSYELTTDFTGKAPTHSFICNGEELNEGGTAAVQRELVREHFNMTNELHQVLTGQLRFTDMNAQQRREWITMLSSADFDYVIGLHNRIKRAVRDTSAVIKHQSGRLVQETSKRIDDQTYNALRKQSQEVCDRLIELHQNSKREMDSRSFHDYERQYHDVLSSIDELLARAKYLKVEIPPSVGTTDEDEIIQLKESLRSRVQMLDAALHEVSEQHQEIDKQLHRLGELEDIDPEALEREIEATQKQIDELHLNFSTPCDYDRIPGHDYCYVAIDEVISLLHSVKADSPEYLDQSTLNAKQTELNDLQDKMMAGTARISELEYRFEHISNCTSIVCPNCSHSFKEGVNADEEGTIKNQLNKGYVFRNTMEAKITAVKEWIQAARESLSVIYDIERIKNTNPDLIELWNYLNAQGGWVRGRELVQFCAKFKRDVGLKMQIQQMSAEISPLVEKLKSIRALDGNQQLREVANSMGERVLNLKELLMEAKETLKEVERFHDRVTESKNITRAVEMAREELDRLMDRMIKFVVVEEVEAQVKRHQVTLASLEQALAEAEIQMGVIRDLTRSLEEAKDEEKALIFLEKLLSPKDGVIAEQILVFINTFIGNINEVIAKVWGYNLALDVCNLADGELDYKFPMYVHNTDNMIDDIRFGSDSQIDIVNQAFRLVTYRFLELHGYPLYLDELGRTFDEVHRLNLTLALKELMEDETYSQIFFISHSFESQNSYPNSQIVVIDDSHVSLKREYNEHVTIT